MAPRNRLAARRKARGFTQESLAHTLEVTTSTVAHWEQGTSTPMARHRRPLAGKLDVSLTELDRLLDTTRGSAPDGHAVNGWLGHFASLEQGASQIRAFEPVVVPGLLQIRDYATAVESVNHVPVTDDEVSRRVEVRMARQRVLVRQPNPLELFAVLDESVLHRMTGGPVVMSAQLDHLADVAQWPNVDLRVVPLDGRVHCAAFGAFQLLTSPGSTAPYMACAEDLSGVRYHDAQHAVDAHAELFEHLSSVALAPAESLDLIHTAAKEIRS
jgi:transcriptional regulator with XRE-family HTH domain